MPPTNDDYAAATAISDPSGTDSASNVGATLELGEPPLAVSGDSSVWWKWIAPAAGVLTVDTFGSSFDTVLDAFTGSSLGSLVSVAVNDNDSTHAPQSAISFTVATGVEYAIRVSGAGAATGSITLHWSFGGSVRAVTGTRLHRVGGGVQ